MGAGGDQVVTDGSFWSMGGYARFVWPCFAFTGLVLAWNLWSARRHHASARQRAARALAMAAGGEE
jgi:heme exporter protein CcmD